MNNCLVTKLKSVVDNDNLRTLNSFIIEVSANTNANFSMVNPGSQGDVITARIIGNGHFSNSSYTTDEGKKITFTQPAGTSAFNCYIVSTGICSIEISGIPYSHVVRDIFYANNTYGNINDFVKYWSVRNIISSYAVADSMNLDFSEIANPSVIKKISIGRVGANISGDINVLSTATDLEELDIWGDNAAYTGNLSFMNNCTKITTLNIGGQITGTAEGVLESWANSGVVRNIKFNIADTKATLNGKRMVNISGRAKDAGFAVITSSTDIKLYKDSASGLLLASYNGSTWTYSNGYES